MPINVLLCVIDHGEPSELVIFGKHEANKYTAKAEPSDFVIMTEHLGRLFLRCCLERRTPRPHFLRITYGLRAQITSCPLLLHCIRQVCILQIQMISLICLTAHKAMSLIFPALIEIGLCLTVHETLRVNHTKYGPTPHDVDLD